MAGISGAFVGPEAITSREGCSVTSRIGAIRQAIDAAGHPALFMVDTISLLALIDYRHNEWGVDVTVAGSQKDLMLPPGLSFDAISARALASHKPAQRHCHRIGGRRPGPA